MWASATAMCRRTVVLLACALIAVLSEQALAEEDLDEILGGFEDEVEPRPTEREPAPPPPSLLPGWLDLKGAVSIATSYGFVPHRTAAEPERKSWNGVNRLRAKLDLEVDMELPAGWQARVSGFGFYDVIYRLRNRDEYENDALRRYEDEVELLEAWVRGSPHPKVDLKLGRQILNWGRSDTLRVLDVINPLDNRDPGLVDIEDLRRPVGMVRVDTFFGDWTLTGLVIPEVRFDLLPPFGSDFVSSPTRLPSTRAPEHWGDDPEFGGSLTGVFRGWDLSLHALRYWENTPRLEAPPASALRFRHDRRTLVGAGGNLTLGNWLVKGELAWIDGVRFSNAEESERFDVMLGLEYYGFEETAIALEVVNRHLTDWELAAKRAPDFAEEDSLEIALRVNLDLLNARLHLLALGIVFGEGAQNGAIGRLQASYDLRDALTATFGLLVFANGDRPPTDGFGDNDRLFAKLTWSF
jgi:hypothetical protein